MGVENPQLFREYITTMTRQTPARKALADRECPKLVAVGDAYGQEQVFLLAQFIRAEGHNTDGLGYFELQKDRIADAYKRAGLAPGHESAKRLFEAEVQKPAIELLKRAFPSRGIELG